MHTLKYIGSKRKASPLQEKSFENDFEHFVPDSNFKHLNFDYSSSETVLIQRIKLRDIFLVTAHSGDLISQCKFITTKYNKK